MNVLAGALQPDAGEMTIDGTPYAPGSPLDASRHGIALIHQELSLCPHLTVAENMLHGPRAVALRAWSTGRRPTRARATLLANFPHPELRPHRIVGRAAARRTAGRRDLPRARGRRRVLLMDEPTSSLQRADVDRLFALIAPAARAGARHRLHQPLPRGGPRDRRRLHRAARRPQRGHRRASPSRPTSSSSRTWSGGRSRTSFRRARGTTPARCVLSVEGSAGAAGGARGELRLAPRRGARHRRTDGLRPHGDGARDLRPRPDAGGEVTVVCAGQRTPAVRALRSRMLRARLAAGIGYLSEDRKGEGLALTDVARRQHHADGLRGVRHARVAPARRTA